MSKTMKEKKENEEKTNPFIEFVRAEAKKHERENPEKINHKETLTVKLTEEQKEFINEYTKKFLGITPSIWVRDQIDKVLNEFKEKFENRNNPEADSEKEVKND